MVSTWQNLLTANQSISNSLALLVANVSSKPVDPANELDHAREKQERPCAVGYARQRQVCSVHWRSLSTTHSTLDWISTFMNISITSVHRKQLRDSVLTWVRAFSFSAHLFLHLHRWNGNRTSCLSAKHRVSCSAGGGKREDWSRTARAMSSVVSFGICTVLHRNVEISFRIPKKPKLFTIT